MPQVATYTTNDPFNPDWGIFLQNEGLGPAFIEFYRVTLDGKVMSGFEIIDQLILEGFLRRRDDAVTRHYEEGLILKAGAKAPVLIFVGSNILSEKAPQFLYLINERINAEYIWCSIYDECETGCSALECERPSDPAIWIANILEQDRSDPTKSIASAGTPTTKTSEERARHVEPTGSIRNSVGYLHLGNARKLEGDLHGAIEAYETSIQIDPDFYAARIAYGRLLTELGRVDEALVHFQNAVQVSPESAEARNDLGITLARVGRHNDAIAQFRQSLDTDPESSATHLNLGIALNGTGRKADAEKEFRLALTIDPGFAKASRELSKVLVEREAYGEAIHVLRGALRIDPKDARSHYYLGIVFAMVQNFEAAIREFDAALDLAPNYEDARRNRENAVKDLKSSR